MFFPIALQQDSYKVIMKTKRLTCLSFLVPAVILIGSVIYLIGCMQLNFGKAALPAEGFLPLISGTLLLIVSAWLTVDGFIKATNASERIERRKAVAFCQLLEYIVGYLILLPLTGFIVSTMTVTMVSRKSAGTFMEAGSLSWPGSNQRGVFCFHRMASDSL